MEWAYGDSIVTFTRMPTDEEAWEAWDVHCPLMSLPRAFGTRPDTVPANMPALLAAPKAQAHWRERLDLAAPGSVRIGIAWAGRKAHQYDARRSLKFAQIAPLLQDPRFTWVSLQKWAPEDERPEIPAHADWLDWTEELTDFADTAALIANLDLVISIDSAMVHLAGALNIPVWMLNRFDSEWRWFHQRADSPWYPKLRIFAQPQFGTWEPVLLEVQKALMALPGQRLQPRKVRRLSAPPSQVPSMHTASVQNGAQAAGTLSVEQAMQLASQHQSAGRLADAERILRQVLQVQPQHAHALHLLGVVAYQAGKPEVAMQLIAQAVGLEPAVALFHSNLAEMNRQQGRVEQAIAHGEQAVTLDASMASAHSNLGIAYYDAQAFEKAEACHHKALALAPHLVQSLNNLGSIARARKDLAAAADWYRKALGVNADYLEALSNLGAVLVEDDAADAAEPSLMRALQLQPAYPEALCNLGLVRLKQERTSEAGALLKRSLALRVDYPEALVGLARVCHEEDQLEEARRWVTRATQVAPTKADAWCQLGSLSMEMGEPEAAQAAYQRALAIDPDMADALTGLGNLKLELGKMDEAVGLLQQAISQSPDNLGARFHLAQASKVKPGDVNVLALEAMATQVPVWNKDKRISYHYALGKSYDDLRDYDRAFEHFLQGAALKRSKLHYDAAADEARGRRIAALTDSRFFERLRGHGDPSTIPVFVLGMPRSGTTLTEQIIASHPAVHGAGELRDLMEVVQQMPAAGGALQPYPENLAALTPEMLNDWGQDYTQRLKRRAPGAQRITDKMPANYLAMGLIPLMLPNARIIHVMRNPVDTCLSCFTRLFNRHQDATYDLHELGRHYATYARLMQHWRATLPAGSFMEVQYEDIVADMQGQARRLIDWVGLPWDEACLEFHKTERSIRTASVTQVRQPIYNSSVERWRHYEKYLGPLLDGLGEFASN